MLYLRSFNRFILISLALLGLSVSSQVQAGIVSYTDSGWWLIVAGRTTSGNTTIGYPGGNQLDLACSSAWLHR